MTMPPPLMQADRIAEVPEPSLPPSDALSETALRAWMRLANAQFSARLTGALLAAFENDPDAIFDASDARLDMVPGFQARHAVRLRDPALQVSDRQWAWVERQGVRVVRRGQADYPPALEEMPDPPPLLFVRGGLLERDRFAVGVVGSRHATPYGRATSERLARELAGHGLTIVSGGAVGIDTAAHRGALAANGRTIAILGCGLDVDYPRENRALFEAIVASGALISEYPLGAQPEAWRFPLRNRLISALTQGTIIVEAPQQSGALITARFAVEQGRTVMVVPGNIDRPSSVGSNALLREGATPILETDDVLRALNLTLLPARPAPPRQVAFDLNEISNSDLSYARQSEGAGSDAPQAAPSAPRPILPALSASGAKLFACLTLTPQHIDVLTRAADVPAVQAGVEMTLLELAGLARRLPGNLYIRALG